MLIECVIWCLLEAAYWVLIGLPILLYDIVKAFDGIQHPELLVDERGSTWLSQRLVLTAELNQSSLGTLVGHQLGAFWITNLVFGHLWDTNWVIIGLPI